MTPKKALDNPYVIRNLIDSVGLSMSIHRYSHWYKQSAAALFAAVGGGTIKLYGLPRGFKFSETLGLSQKFGKSNLKMLTETYPEAALKPWLFLATPKAIWDDFGTVISFIGTLLYAQCCTTLTLLTDYATWKMRIRELEDWYRVSAEHLAFLGGLQLRTHLPEVFRFFYIPLTRLLLFILALIVRLVFQTGS